MFGAVATQPLAPVEPQVDSRVALLEAELAELRESIKAAQEETPVTEPAPQAPTTDLDAAALKRFDINLRHIRQP